MIITVLLIQQGGSDICGQETEEEDPKEIDRYEDAIND